MTAPAADRAGLSESLLALDAITRRLRRDCPWDREQDERSIVPHTVEEAYELADAAESGDDAGLLDELGDVLFQVLFLSLLLEERGVGDLARVADGCREKLVRRHPHVFGDAEAADAEAVLSNWDAIKREQERGGELFGELAGTLPATLHARKLLRRAEGAGRPLDDPVGRAGAAIAELGRLIETGSGRDAVFGAAGNALLAAVECVRVAGADPELALRAAAGRFRDDVEQEAEADG